MYTNENENGDVADVAYPVPRQRNDFNNFEAFSPPSHSSPYKKWAQVVGWFQLVSSAIAIVAHVMLFVALLGKRNIFLDAVGQHGSHIPSLVEYEVNRVLWIFKSAWIISILVYTVDYAGGLVLLVGVAQGSRGKIFLWLSIEGIVILLSLVGIGLHLLSHYILNVFIIVGSLIFVMFRIMFVCIVTRYLKQL